MARNSIRIVNQDNTKNLQIAEYLHLQDTNPNLLDGYKVTIGLTNGFNIASNAKYPNTMIAFSRIN